MGKRGLDFSREHPEDSPGYTAAVTRLDTLLGQAASLATQQQEGSIEERTATQVKRELRRALTQGHLDHLKRVARVASAEVPELRKKFVKGKTPTYMAFRTAAGRIAADAAASKDTLVQHGLSETVLGGLNQMLAKFDAALVQSASGKRAHTGASAELDKVGREIVEAVSVLDGLNRSRFVKGSDPLGAWISARKGASAPHPAADHAPVEVPVPVTPPAAA